MVFDDNDIHPTIRKPVYEIREYDLQKINYLKEIGYDVLVIWENEYTDDKKNVMNVIKEYLNDTDS